MKVAVTGATGLVGRALVAALRERGDEVVEVGRGEDPPREPDLLVHLAAQTVVSAAFDDPVATFEANVALTWRVLAAAGARRSIVASSDQVYGPHAPVPTPETAPLAPEGPYAASKAAADVLARTQPGTVVARLANVFGPGDRHESRLVPGTIAAVRAGRRPVIRGDGSAARDLLHVDDAVAALLALAEAGEPGEAYNVGTGTPRTVSEVIAAVLAAAGSDLEPEVLGGTPAGEGGRRALDVTKIRAATGWSPAVSLEEGLRRTLRF